MGRQAIFAVVFWLTCSQTIGDKRMRGSIVQDNESAESAPRLYRNVPLGVYASAAPYAAYSFHLPTFAAAPKAAASHIIPVKENFVNHLTDSYGNKFVGTPQLTTYKIAFPQQFVPLQTKLPEHLAQPLVAASANFQFKQSNGQFFGAPYRVSALQGPVPTPLNSFPTFGHLYGDKVKNLAPNSVIYNQPFGILNTHQQSTNNKAVFTNNQSHEQYANLKNDPKFSQQTEPQIIIGIPKGQGIQAIPPESHGETKFEKIQEVPHSSHAESKFQRIQESPHTLHGDAKFQRIQDSPHSHQSDAKFQRIQDYPHSHHSDAKFQRIQDSPHSHQSDAKFQRIQDYPHSHHSDAKFQRIQDSPHTHHSDGKLQRIQDSPHTYQGDVKFQRIQETPNTHHGEPNSQQQSHGEEQYQQVQELPHYQSKYQIIEEQPHSPQNQRIKEHHAPHEEVKFQRAQEASPTAQTQHTYERSHEKPQYTGYRENTQKPQSSKAKLQAAPGKQTVTYINDINGKKTIVELETKPSLPLLDLTLLEPLTFDNPLVPQVQHFLPRINQATYQKLPQANIPSVKNYQKEYVVQKTTSYDSAELHDKPQKDASKKKHKKPTQPNKHSKKNDAPKKTTVTYHETLDDAPEIVYEINSPNYKETIKEKAVSYNKQTQSDPVHYSYGTNSEKDPVTYSYSRTSKEPVQIKSVEYNGNGPSHLIYNFKPEEQAHEEKSHHSASHHNDDENEHESNDDGSAYHRHQNTKQYKEHPHSSEDHHESSHKEKDNHYKEKGNYHKEEEKQPKVVHDSPPKYHSEPVQFTSENINFQPILREYENNIRLLTVPSASIKVDPHQHVQQAKSTPQPHVNHREEHSQPQHQRPHSSPAPQEHLRSSPEPQRHDYLSSPHSESYDAPAPHIHEKSKRVIIHEEAPDEMHMLREQMRKEVINREENSEEDFEKAYHDAALGFPAYNQMSDSAEKDIFDPESYGVPHDHVEYDFDSTPFQQYQEEGDEFPKESRSRYKDSRDKMKQNYYSDFSISKPESTLDRYQNKLGYYKLFKQQKPDYLADDEEDKKQKSAKYTAIPYDFNSSQDKGKSYYGSPAPKQQLYEYDYSKGTPRDNSAFASRPYQSFKSRSSFVEPQFQYGFEPISIPKLLDSELAAMASNDSPESEKPGMRKKTYKENWYIKKTSTSAGAPAS